MIIGLGHQSRVGKDTCGKFFASILRVNGHENVKSTAFARELKNISHKLFKCYGVREAAYYEQNPEARDKIIEPLCMDVVSLWIEVGQKMREVHQDVWLDSVLYGKESNWTIITDVRFLNEVDAIRAKGGVVIKVQRDRQEPRGSDREIPEDYEWDYYIDNNGDLKTLYLQCEQILEALNER